VLKDDFSCVISPLWLVSITAAATGLVKICTSSLSVASLTLFLIASRCFVPYAAGIVTVMLSN
jgi:hypothetical protein